MTYSELLNKYQDQVLIKCMVIIDNRSMVKTYSIYTNLHVGFGICTEMMNALYTAKKGKYNKTVGLYKKALGRKIRLTSTDNDANYTRLIYTLV